jgi:carboxypeptidase family protein
MRVGWTAVVVAPLFAATAWADSPEPLQVRASVQVALSPVLPTEIVLADDGTAVVTQGDRAGQRFRLEMRLTESERADVRRAVADSKFFEDWGPPGGASDAPDWNVKVVLGSRERERSHIERALEFAPLERLLFRYVEQAEVLRSLVEGDAVRVADQIGQKPFRERLLRPQEVEEALPAALVDVATTSSVPFLPPRAAELLLESTPADGFGDLVRKTLARVEGERRDGVLLAWANELLAIHRHHPDADPIDRSVQRRAFAPFAVAEIRAHAAEWTSASDKRRRLLIDLLDVALISRDPAALPTALDVLRARSTPDTSFVSSGLVAWGPDAVPVAAALLDDETSSVRRAGAELARALLASSEPRKDSGPESAALREQLVARFDTELLPPLHRRATREGEPPFVREACHGALDVRRGRDRAAEQREAAEDRSRRWAESEAQRKDAEARRKQTQESGPPPPRGELAISGRLLGPKGVGLAGFDVFAEREDGPPPNPRRRHGTARTADDGSFRIEGLVGGEFTVSAWHPTWSRRSLSRNPSVTEGVLAGSADVVLRFVGTMIRGRLVDERGASAPRWLTVTVRMRDVPPDGQNSRLAAQGSASLDADGRFVVAQLLPGVYDVTVAGHPLLVPSTVRPGPDEVRIAFDAGMTVTGRVLDERGEPLPGAQVTLGRSDVTVEPLRATSADDGTFRIFAVDPVASWRAVASFTDPVGHVARRSAPVSVVLGTEVELRLDTGPRLELRVDFGKRRPGAGSIRLVRAGGDAPQREFGGERVGWRWAEVGTWRVFALARDLDANGDPTTTWLEIGTVTTGEPEKTLRVPK